MSAPTEYVLDIGMYMNKSPLQYISAEHQEGLGARRYSAS
jgi:hypothetical protein